MPGLVFSDSAEMIPRCRCLSGFTWQDIIGELRLRDHLRPINSDSQGTYPPTPSALRQVFRAYSGSTIRLLRPLLTSRSGWRRHPFRHEARYPQVRTHSFTAQPPDLRHFALATRASRLLARSPCSAAPCIRFLSIGSQFRSTLPPHGRSPFRSCASLRSLWPAHGRTCTSKSAPMLGAPKKGPRGAQ